MPSNLDVLVAQFKDSLMAELELQQTASILSGTVLEGPLRGRHEAIPVAQKRSFREKQDKHQLLTPKEGVWRWRKADAKPALDDVWFTDEDQLRSSIVDYRQAFAQQMAYAAARWTDDLILSALFGTAYEGETEDSFSPVPFDSNPYVRSDKSGGMVLAEDAPEWKTVNAALAALRENQNDMSMVTFATTERVWERFRADGENQVWWNSSNAIASQLVNTGNIGNIYGLNVKIVESPFLDSTATSDNDTNYGVFYTKNAAKLLTVSDFQVEARKPDTYANSRIIYAGLDKGCTRLIERGVFVVEFDLT